MKWNGCGSHKDFFYSTKAALLYGAQEYHKTPQYIYGLRIKSRTFLAGSKPQA
jgi:hypothetical protein